MLDFTPADIIFHHLFQYILELHTTSEKNIFVSNFHRFTQTRPTPPHPTPAPPLMTKICLAWQKFFVDVLLKVLL